MKARNVQLRQEVYESDAREIADWLDDHEVVQYLNEGQNVAESIKQAIQRVNMPILTHLFNQNGGFFVVTEEKQPVGFLRLVPKGKSAEMVIVIGDKKKWGKGLGENAILQGLRHAFFEWRMNEVIAKISFKNIRSIRAFRSIGFKQNKKSDKEIHYSISIEEFLKIS